MLTPDDIQKKIFTLGRKLENNDVGIFVKEMQINYQLIYDQVNEQAKQITGMEKKLKYYRDVEGSLQDALVHAEKVSDAKIKESQKEALKIEEEAHKKAEDIIADAKSELAYLKSIIVEFEKAYDTYQDKYKDFIQGQIKFIEDSKKFMEDEKVNVKKFVSNIDIEPSVSKSQLDDVDNNDKKNITIESEDTKEDLKDSSTSFKMPQFEMPSVDNVVDKVDEVKEEADKTVDKNDKSENVGLDEGLFDKLSFDSEEDTKFKDSSELLDDSKVEDNNNLLSETESLDSDIDKKVITNEENDVKINIPLEDVNKSVPVENIDIQSKETKKETFSFANILGKGNESKDTSFDIPEINTQKEVEEIVDIPSISDLNQQNDEVVSSDAMVNTDDLFDLPEIDVNDIDFSNLNFNETPKVEDSKIESPRVDFNTMNTPPSPGVDFNAMNAPKSPGVDFNAMNTPPSPGVDFNAMNAPKSPGVDFNAMNAPKSSGVDFNAMNTPPSPGVDFNAMNTPPSQGVDFNAMNTPPSPGVDFNAMNTPPSPGVDFNAMNAPKSPGVDFNTMNTPPSLGVDFNSNEDKVSDDDGPDLSQNSNIELTFANQSMFPKKKKDDKDKLFASLNLSSNKDEEKARIKQLESSYARDLLNSNQQLASQGVDNNISEAPQRGYGPADFVSENKGFASKPLNPAVDDQKPRKTLF